MGNSIQLKWVNFLLRPLTSGEGVKTRLLGKHKRPAHTSRSVAAEAKEVATCVRSMIDTQRKSLNAIVIEIAG